MEKILLPNYGFVKTKLPQDIYTSVLKECLNIKNKKEFFSGLTELGVAKHYYVKNNLDKIQNFMSTVVDYYNEQYPNYLKGINLIGLRRKKYDNKKIMELDQAYKKIFSSNNLHENLNKINGEYKGNELVQEVTKFIEKDKKRPICTPLAE